MSTSVIASGLGRAGSRTHVRRPCPWLGALAMPGTPDLFSVVVRRTRGAVTARRGTGLVFPHTERPRLAGSGVLIRPALFSTSLFRPLRFPTPLLTPLLLSIPVFTRGCLLPTSGRLTRHTRKVVFLVRIIGFFILVVKRSRTVSTRPTREARVEERVIVSASARCALNVAETRWTVIIVEAGPGESRTHVIPQVVEARAHPGELISQVVEITMTTTTMACTGLSTRSAAAAATPSFSVRIMPIAEIEAVRRHVFETVEVSCLLSLGATEASQ